MGTPPKNDCVLHAGFSVILHNYSVPLIEICNSNHMFESAIWDELPEGIFENFETARVKRGQFQHFQKSRG